MGATQQQREELRGSESFAFSAAIGVDRDQAAAEVGGRGIHNIIMVMLAMLNSNRGGARIDDEDAMQLYRSISNTRSIGQCDTRKPPLLQREQSIANPG